MVLPRKMNSRTTVERSFLIRRLTTITLCMMVFVCGYLMISDVMGDSSEINDKRNLSLFEQRRTQQILNHQNVVIRDNQEEEKQSLLKKMRDWDVPNGVHSHQNGDTNKERQKKTIEVDLDDKSPSSPLQILLSAKVHLIDIYPDQRKMLHVTDDNTYAGVDAIFCQLDFSQQRKDPSSVPMFRYVVAHSPGCEFGPQYKVDLKGFADLARIHDAEVSTGDLPKSLNLTGVVFHESRCGSTLVANALVAMNPSEHRVFSESSPPISAMRNVCGENLQFCSVKQAAAVLKDVMYLMGRSDNGQEKRVFFKIQSVGSLSIKIFQLAYPNIPWLYVYRDPVQVMMSHLQGYDVTSPMGVRNANCVQGRRRGGKILARHVEQRTSFASINDLTDIQYCAAHLATLTQSAADSIEESFSTTLPSKLMGRAINYEDLPAALWKSALPDHFGLGTLSEVTIKRIQDISGVYSKGTRGRHGEFKEDSESKERKATPEIRDAAETFLQESYERLLKYGFDGIRRL